MKKVIIIHGFNGSPNGGWRAWLMGELDASDVYACALPMPSPDVPAVDAWVAEIARVVERDRSDEMYLVGHSLGVPAILRYLERAPQEMRIAGAVLVSGPIEPVIVNKAVDTFLTAPFDFEAIRRKIGRVAVIHGDDDDRVPLAQGERLARELAGDLIVVRGGGHLTGSGGWKSLPQCLASLKRMIALNEKDPI